VRRAASLLLIGTMAVWAVAGNGLAQGEERMVRLARLVIDAAQLDAYKAELQQEIEASLRLEPGVITLYAVSEKDQPTRFTILEIYASREAYEKHIKTPHFLKYKIGTEKMVKSLELVETVPLLPSLEIKKPR
jgi:quinol monooxygenase YgiN